MEMHHLGSAAVQAASSYTDASTLQLLRRADAATGRTVTQLPQAPQAAAGPAALDAGLGRHLDVKA